MPSPQYINPRHPASTMASTRKLQIDGEIHACRAELEGLGIGGRAALGVKESSNIAIGVIARTVGLLNSLKPSDEAPALIKVVHKGLEFVLSDAQKLDLTAHKHHLDKERANVVATQLSRYLEFVPIITKQTESPANAGIFDKSAKAISDLALAYVAKSGKNTRDLLDLFNAIGENLISIPDSVGESYTALLKPVGEALKLTPEEKQK